MTAVKTESAAGARFSFLTTERFTMKVFLNLELDGSERDVRILSAIARAINNVPPEGYTEVRVGEDPKPAEVTIHASSEKAEEAVESVNLNDAATAKVEKLVENQVDKTPDDTKDKGQRLRELLLGVSKIDGQNIQTAKKIAADAAGIMPDEINKDFPNHPKVDDAIKALEGLIE